MERLLIELAGWGGAGLLLLAYALLSAERLKGSSKQYQMLNLIGSAGLVANTLYHGAYPSTMVNLVWAGIAVYAMARLFTWPRDAKA